MNEENNSLVMHHALSILYILYVFGEVTVVLWS